MTFTKAAMVYTSVYKKNAVNLHLHHTHSKKKTELQFVETEVNIKILAN